MKLKLRDYQVAALKFVEGRGERGAGLFMRMGTGKTIVAIRSAKLPALVVCRRDDYLTWKKELENDGHLPVFVEDYDNLPEPSDWVVTTWDSLRDSRVFYWLQSIGFRTAIGDELHKVKRIKAQRTKRAIKLVHEIPYRIGMTGTPITQRPMDVFALALFIDRGETFGTNFWVFLNRYFVKDPYIGAWNIKREGLQKIRRLIPNFSWYVHEDDVLNLPPVTRVIKSVRMTGMQQRVYRQLDKDWELCLNGEVFEFKYIFQRIIKMKQVTAGFCYNGGVINWLRTNKLDIIKDLVNEEFAHKPKVVIWSAFIPEITAISRILSEKFVTFYGSDPERKLAARLQFQDDPKTRFFIGQADSGIGMNELVVADTAIYATNSVRVESRDQADARIRRSGSERHKSITYVDIITENTIDEDHYRGLVEKREIGNWMMELAKRKTRSSNSGVDCSRKPR